jgi:predicted SAM-dependent methyltransferase
MKRELLIGCGSYHKKLMASDGTNEWSNLTTLDYNEDHKPDVCWDLMELPLPFKDEEFDEIHAYEVLEHLGQQGDYKLFFAQFSEFWRLLKPNGHFLATCPSRNSVWAYGDPSHTRIMQLEQLVFLSQDQYKKQVGKTPMSDFRNIYKADFETVYQEDDGEAIRFVLKAIKN